MIFVPLMALMTGERWGFAEQKRMQAIKLVLHLLVPVKDFRRDLVHRPSVITVSTTSSDALCLILKGAVCFKDACF